MKDTDTHKKKVSSLIDASAIDKKGSVFATLGLGYCHL